MQEQHDSQAALSRRDFLGLASAGVTGLGLGALDSA